MRAAACILLLFAALNLPIPAQAEDDYARLSSSGVEVKIDPNGNLLFRPTTPLILDDGRKLEKVDGKWHMTPPNQDSIKEISAVDLAVFGENYIGRRIKVIGGHIISADVSHIQLRLPGSYITASLDGVPRDIVKRLIEECPMLNDRANCSLDITGDVRRSRYGDNLELANVLIQP